MTTEISKDVEKWIKHPHFFKHKIQEAIKNGSFVLLMSDKTLTEDKLQQLRILLSENLKCMDTKDLVKLYKNLDKSSLSLINAQTKKIEKHFIKINPMKRDYAHLRRFL